MKPKWSPLSIIISIPMIVITGFILNCANEHPTGPPKKDENNAPAFVTDPDSILGSAKAYQLYLFTFSVKDKDGDSLRFSFVDSAQNMALSDSIFSWMPRISQKGSVLVTISVTDGKGGADSISWTITVSTDSLDIDTTVLNDSAMAGQELVDTVVISGIPADYLVLNLINPPAGMALQGNIITWTPSFSDTGVHNLEIVIADAVDTDTARIDTLEWALTVYVGSAHFIQTSGYPAAIPGTPFQQPLDIYGLPRGEFVVDLVSGHSGITLQGSSLSWDSPAINDTGDYNISVRLGDAVGSDTIWLDTLSWTLSVLNTDLDWDNAVMESTAVTGFACIDTIPVNSVLTDYLVLSLIKSRDGMVLNNNVFMWIPVKADTGKTTVSVAAAIHLGYARVVLDTLSWSIEVSALNTTPEFITSFSAVQRVAKKGAPYTDTLQAVDMDGDALSFSLIKNPAGMTLTDSVVAWTPSATGLDTISVRVSDPGNESDTITWVVAIRQIVLNNEMVSNHTVPDFYFHFDYVDTIRTDAKGYTYTFADSAEGAVMKFSGADSMVLSYSADDSFCVVTWTYDTVNMYYDSVPAGGSLPVSVIISDGQVSDTVSWDIHINTVPWIHTSQYQVTTDIYIGNYYTDTIYVTDEDGDNLTFSAADDSGLGLKIIETGKINDTTYCIIEWLVSALGSFPVTIDVKDPYGYDKGLETSTTIDFSTSLLLPFYASMKTIITSKPELMKFAVAIDSAYVDTIGVFDEYRDGLTFTLLEGPGGMILTDSIVFWMPASAVEDTVVVAVALGTRAGDTISWPVKSVALEKYVFWYNAVTNGYGLQDCDDKPNNGRKGPCLPSDAVVDESMIATWNTRLERSDNTSDFALGNGPTQRAGSGMIWSQTLCDMTGTVISAKVRGEYREGWSTVAFCNEGRITMKVGVIDLTVYRDLAGLGYGGSITCDANWKGGMGVLGNPWHYNMMFYYHPGTQTIIEGLMAEEIKTFQAPAGRPAQYDPSVLDGQFCELDVTNQVQWILNQRGKDYVETGKDGDYAIVFLVPRDETAGGTGKINLFADECSQGDIGHSDEPWTADANTMHFYIEGYLEKVNP